MGVIALITAVKYNSLEIIDMLLDAGATIDLQDNFGRTPLFTSALMNFRHITEHLIKRGARTDIPDNVLRDPCEVAAMRGHTEMLELGHPFNSPCQNSRA
jgi:ankyrin repeat protein